MELGRNGSTAEGVSGQAGAALFNPLRLGISARRDLLGALDDLPSAPLARSRLRLPFVVVQNFEYAQQVLVADQDSYERPGFIRRVMTEGLGDNLFTVDGDQWLRRRQPVAPMFGVGTMNAMAALMAGSIVDQLESWRRGNIDAQRAMTDLTIDAACRALLGTRADDGGIGATIRDEFETIVGWLSDHLQNPALPPSTIPTPNNRRMRQARSNLIDAIRQLIAERRRETGDRGDLLSRLLQAQRDEADPGIRLTDDEIVDECVGTMFAGHETTAATLSWALYQLAANPAAQARVAREGDAVDPASPTLFDDVASLTFTDAVVEEVLRLYPPAVSIARVAKRHTSLGAERIRKGSIVMIAVYRIQRDPTVWDRPDDFDPERTLPTTDSGLRDSFVAFGLGPRRCLGARFARTEVRLALALICARWQLTYVGSTPPVPEVSPSLRIKGTLPIELSPRQRHEGQATGL